uniref:MRG domain-containing protein n=1 Tax=Steinernema glaseri TaxID=37863 RepID=A0A1I8AQQ1_9BILA
MDGVPIAFCEHLFELLSVTGVAVAEKLSGSYGTLARHVLDHWARYMCRVSDGGIKGYVLYMKNGRSVDKPKEVEAIPKKFVRDVWIFLEETENASREVIRRFPYAQEYNFVLKSSSISEAWVDFACSLR